MDGRSCGACGASCADDARFCSQCAAPLEAVRLDQPATVREERRQITVLFSDASGYTQMAEDLDPEVVRDVMGLVYAKADAIVEKYGGRIDKLMGDAVLAVFGDPVAHEDDAARAVRAALELHAGVESMRPMLEARGGGRSFAMHSGINSGVVVTGDLAGDRASGPLGDMVNVASRLQSIAGSGEVLIGPETAAMVKGRFALTDLGERELKGRREPVHVRRVDALLTERNLPSRRASAFVGRREEIGILTRAVKQLRAGQSAVVTVCAEAGGGKTRLLEEVRSRLDSDVQWLEGRAYPYTTNIPYAPVIDMINRAAGIDETDSADEVRSKLTAVVHATLPGDERSMVALAHLYGLGPMGAEVDLESFRSMLLETMVALVDEIANRAPTVVCLQDLHWIDPSTADLVREMVGAVSAPVLTICNFRPGFELGAPGEQVLHLSELTRHHTFDQLVSLLDGSDPPDELVAVVTARADGNPFFVEEIVNSLIETGVLAHEADEWVLRKQLDEAVVPSTIRGLIASRIDNLDPHRRRVLREVSVVGREFLYRLVRDVSSTPEELDGSLAELAAADLIREKSNDPELEYIFKHALTQEVAYEGLVRRERQDLHERVAHAIESVLGDRAGEYVETLAYHYQRSGHVPEAVGYLRRAGRKALDRYAIAEADAHYRSAYELLTAADPDGAPLGAATQDRMLLEVILDWCHVHYYACAYTELHGLQVLHPDLPDRVGDDALRAQWLGWSGQAAFALNDVNGSAAVLDEAIEVGERSGDPTSLGYALVWQMWTLANFGQSERAVTLWPQVQALLSGITDPYARRYTHIKGLGGLAYAAIMRGDTKTTRVAAAELLEIGTRTGNRRASAMGHISLSSLHLSLGNRQPAMNEAVAARDADADTIYSLLANVWFAGINANWGDAELLQATVDEWRPATVRLGLPQFTTWFDFFGSISAVKSGQLSRGMRGIDDARERFTHGHNEWGLLNVDVALAQMYRQIATGEASGKASDGLRNPAFVLKHARGAAKRARVALESLAETVEARGFGYLQAGVQLELGKLAAHERRHDDARTHLAYCLDLLAHEPDATYAREAAELLESV